MDMQMYMYIIHVHVYVCTSVNKCIHTCRCSCKFMRHLHLQNTCMYPCKVPCHLSEHRLHKFCHFSYTFQLYMLQGHDAGWCSPVFNLIGVDLIEQQTESVPSHLAAFVVEIERDVPDIQSRAHCGRCKERSTTDARSQGLHTHLTSLWFIS